MFRYAIFDFDGTLADTGAGVFASVHTCRFADTLAPEMDKLKAEAAKWAIQEEDVLTYAMFPQVAPKFFEKRNAKAQGVDADHADFANKSHPV